MSNQSPEVKRKPAFPASDKEYALLVVWYSLLEGEEVPQGVSISVASKDLGTLVVLGGIPEADQRITDEVLMRLQKNNPGRTFMLARTSGVITRRRIRKFVHGENRLQQYKYEEALRKKLGEEGLTNADIERIIREYDQFEEGVQTSDIPALDLFYAIFAISSGQLKKTRNVDDIKIGAPESRLYLRQAKSQQ